MKNYKFEVLKIAQIPSDFLPKEIKDELEGREAFTDTDEELEEKIYNGLVFDDILDEQKNNRTLSDATIKELEIYNRSVQKYEYFMVTNV